MNDYTIPLWLNINRFVFNRTIKITLIIYQTTFVSTKMKCASIFIPILSFWVTSSSITVVAQSSQTLSYDISELTSQIERSIRKHKIAGATLAVFNADRIIWSSGFGFADKEKHIKATDSTIYKCGSVSKLFVCTAIMQLHEQELIHIDSPVAKYLTDFSMKNRFSGATLVTIRHLLTHHGGIPSDIFSGIVERSPDHFSTVIQSLSSDYYIFPPGLIYAYSNVGYSLLGTIVERISGLSFENYVQENILDVIEMKRSSFLNLDLNMAEIAAVYDNDGHRTEEIPLRDVPAGGLYSSVVDLSVFSRQYFNTNYPKILDTNTIEEIFNTQNKTVSIDMGNEIGLAWHIMYTNSGKRIYLHNGATLYYRALLAIIPESNIGIVMLANSRKGDYLIRDCLQFIEKDLENKSPHSKTQSPVSELPAGAHYADSIVGIYTNPGLVVHVFSKKKKLFAELNNTKLRLVEENGVYTPKIKVLGIIPIKLKKVHFEFLQVDSFRCLVQVTPGKIVRQMIGVKIKNRELTEIWESRLGRYSILSENKDAYNLVSDFELINEQGLLILMVKDKLEKQQLRIVLKIKSDNFAISEGLGRYAGNAMQVIKEDGKEILEIYGFRLIKQ